MFKKKREATRANERAAECIDNRVSKVYPRHKEETVFSRTRMEKYTRCENHLGSRKKAGEKNQLQRKSDGRAGAYEDDPQVDQVRRRMAEG